MLSSCALHWTPPSTHTHAHCPCCSQLHPCTHPTHQSVWAEHIRFQLAFNLQTKMAFSKKSQITKVADEKRIPFFSHTHILTHILVSHFYSINEVEMWKWIVRVTAIAEGSFSCGHYWLCRHSHATLIPVKPWSLGVGGYWGTANVFI